MPLDSTNYAETKTDAVSRVLLRAIDIIGERGWCQDGIGLCDERVPVCAVAAINAAIESNDWDERNDIYWGAAKRCGFENPDFLGRWNDEKGRSEAEVIARLREAAYS